jgi:HTH-type transcriptional regulator/antitoxin HigA
MGKLLKFPNREYILSTMIRSLHTHLSIPAEILIKDGMNFPLDGEGVKWDSFPVTEIVDRGWVTGFDPKIQSEYPG